MLPKIIPRPLFQVFAILSLLGTWGLLAFLVVIHGRPVSLLIDALGLVTGSFVAWVAASLLWSISILPLRLMTPFPTLNETLKAGSAASFGELVAKEREALRNVQSLPPSERRRRHGIMAVTSFILSVAFAVAFAINVELFPEHVLLVPAAIAVLGVCMGAYHSLRALLAR